MDLQLFGEPSYHQELLNSQHMLTPWVTVVAVGSAGCTQFTVECSGHRVSGTAAMQIRAPVAGIGNLHGASRSQGVGLLSWAAIAQGRVCDVSIFFTEPAPSVAAIRTALEAPAPSASLAATGTALEMPAPEVAAAAEAAAAAKVAAEAGEAAAPAEVAAAASRVAATVAAAEALQAEAATAAAPEIAPQIEIAPEVAPRPTSDGVITAGEPRTSERVEPAELNTVLTITLTLT